MANKTETNIKSERSFIVDFGCCLPFGHNLQSVKLFQQREAARGREALAIVCRQAKSYASFQLKDFFFTLPTLYAEILWDAEQSRIKRIWRRFSGIFALLIGGRLLRNWRASRAVRRMFKQHRIAGDDLLILPSAEYYGTKALLKRLRRVKPQQRPRVHLRLIGVLEAAKHSFYKNRLLELVTLLNASPEKITVSAEVPRYARYLNSILISHTVIAEPFPLEAIGANIETTGDGAEARNNHARGATPFTVVLPGVNRIDKGYFELFNLCKEIFFRFPDIRIVIQDMKTWDPDYKAKYQRKLGRLVNVELTPAILSREQIMEMYRRADLILLHYHPASYFYRGSAIHYEAIARGIPVLARKGSGFVEEIENWESGWAYETKPELFARLEEAMSYQPEQLRAKMAAASAKFEQEVKKADEATLYYLS
ncbi:MAG: glycosyltransferase [Leptospirales bacterium]|jgi:glycosyltransferase involved in cell wall biosynthesis